MRLPCFIVAFLLTLSNALGQIPDKIKKAADSINLHFLGSNVSKSQYACGQTFYKNGQTVYDCTGRLPKKEKVKNVVFYSLYYLLTFSPNSHYFYKINLDPKVVLIDDVELPPCATGQQCEVKIDSVQAIELALESGLNADFGIINEGLAVDPETRKFVWQIKNRSKKEAYEGLMIWIDAYTGERLRNKDKPWLQINLN